MNKYKIIIVVSQGHCSSTFSVVGSVNFRTRLERPLVLSMGDSEIFHVQLLKTFTKNYPGSQLRYFSTCSHSLPAEGWETNQDPDVPQLGNLCTKI